MRDTAEVKRIKVAIALHEKALSDLERRQAEAAANLENFKAREIAEESKYMRRGQMAIFLEPSAERDELERKYSFLAGEVERITKKLEWLNPTLANRTQNA